MKRSHRTARVIVSALALAILTGLALWGLLDGGVYPVQAQQRNLGPGLDVTFVLHTDREAENIDSEQNRFEAIRFAGQLLANHAAFQSPGATHRLSIIRFASEVEVITQSPLFFGGCAAVADYPACVNAQADLLEDRIKRNTFADVGAGSSGAGLINVAGQLGNATQGRPRIVILLLTNALADGNPESLIDRSASRFNNVLQDQDRLYVAALEDSTNRFAPRNLVSRWGNLVQRWVPANQGIKKYDRAKPNLLSEAMDAFLRPALDEIGTTSTLTVDLPVGTATFEMPPFTAWASFSSFDGMLRVQNPLQGEPVGALRRAERNNRMGSVTMLHRPVPGLYTFGGLSAEGKVRVTLGMAKGTLILPQNPIMWGETKLIYEVKDQFGQLLNYRGISPQTLSVTPKHLNNEQGAVKPILFRSTATQAGVMEAIFVPPYAGEYEIPVVWDVRAERVASPSTSLTTRGILDVIPLTLQLITPISQPISAKLYQPVTFTFALRAGNQTPTLSSQITLAITLNSALKESTYVANRPTTITLGNGAVQGQGSLTFNELGDNLSVPLAVRVNIGGSPYTVTDSLTSPRSLTVNVAEPSGELKVNSTDLLYIRRTLTGTFEAVVTREALTNARHSLCMQINRAGQVVAPAYRTVSPETFALDFSPTQTGDYSARMEIHRVTCDQASEGTIVTAFPQATFTVAPLALNASVNLGKPDQTILMRTTLIVQAADETHANAIKQRPAGVSLCARITREGDAAYQRDISLQANTIDQTFQFPPDQDIFADKAGKYILTVDFRPTCDASPDQGSVVGGAQVLFSVVPVFVGFVGADNTPTLPTPHQFIRQTVQLGFFAQRGNAYELLRGNFDVPVTLSVQSTDQVGTLEGQGSPYRLRLAAPERTESIQIALDARTLGPLPVILPFTDGATIRTLNDPIRLPVIPATVATAFTPVKPASARQFGTAKVTVTVNSTLDQEVYDTQSFATANGRVYVQLTQILGTTNNSWCVPLTYLPTEQAFVGTISLPYGGQYNALPYLTRGDGDCKTDIALNNVDDFTPATLAVAEVNLGWVNVVPQVRQGQTHTFTARWQDRNGAPVTDLGDQTPRVTFQARQTGSAQPVPDDITTFTSGTNGEYTVTFRPPTADQFEIVLAWQPPNLVVGQTVRPESISHVFSSTNVDFAYLELAGAENQTYYTYPLINLDRQRARELLFTLFFKREQGSQGKLRIVPFDNVLDINETQLRQELRVVVAEKSGDTRGQVWLLACAASSMIQPISTTPQCIMEYITVNNDPGLRVRVKNIMDGQNYEVTVALPCTTEKANRKPDVTVFSSQTGINLPTDNADLQTAVRCPAGALAEDYPRYTNTIVASIVPDPLNTVFPTLTVALIAILYVGGLATHSITLMARRRTGVLLSGYVYFINKANNVEQPAGSWQEDLSRYRRNYLLLGWTPKWAMAGVERVEIATAPSGQSGRPSIKVRIWAERPMPPIIGRILRRSSWWYNRRADVISATLEQGEQVPVGPSGRIYFVYAAGPRSGQAVVGTRRQRKVYSSPAAIDPSTPAPLFTPPIITPDDPSPISADAYTPTVVAAQPIPDDALAPTPPTPPELTPPPMTPPQTPAEDLPNRRNRRDRIGFNPFLPTATDENLKPLEDEE